jgi:CheY-like chemotaxis protein
MMPVPSLANKPPLLIVEDEALIRAGLVLQFESGGYQVYEAANADEALALLQADTCVSAVITDLHMPGRIDGIGLVAWLGKHRPGVPVIVVSGYTIGLGNELHMPVSAVISKPYNPAELVAVLEHLLEHLEAASTAAGIA